MTQREYAQQFHALHQRGKPLVLFNCWDAGSAKAVAASGASAIATGSWSVASAHGFDDSEQLPLELVLANLRRIVAAVSLPVTLDFESGYAREASALQANIAAVIAAGAVGINFEDQIVGGSGMYAPDVQAKRIAAVRAAADSHDFPLFINARTDVFLQADAATHNEALLEQVIVRANAYAAAGASGFFAPGLRDLKLIETLCQASPLPVNIMMAPGMCSVAELAAVGVARASYGPFPYRQVMAGLQEAAAAALRSAQR